MVSYIGTHTSRVDGRAKVTGAAKYAADFNSPGLVYCSVVSSTIAKGRILHIDASKALRVPGVIDVLTHEHRPPMADTDRAYKDDVAPAGTPFRPLYDSKIMFSGQPIALVLAEEWEIARFAASLVHVEYEKETHVTDLYRRREDAFALTDPAKPRGDAAKAFAAADVRHEGEYYVPIEHHNPMEPFASTVTWDGGGKLTVYDKTQGVQNVQRYVCSVFNLNPDDVRVISLFVGGAFGAGLRPQYQVVLAVLAARALERSIRLVLTRQQMYSLGYRPGMIQRIQLGAKA
ncbi:MAG: xanthine dehydrogenase YagR molybdenum-binding subunit, partial [Micromonosporaceae bacterium]|nr:xanthine dehydrogenase YagR molybdenum-binding subunit [Micromonosporaceae bacterium]